MIVDEEYRSYLKRLWQTSSLKENYDIEAYLDNESLTEDEAKQFALWFQQNALSIRDGIYYGQKDILKALERLK